MRSNRLKWADIAKGLSIILIVFIHSGEGIYTATGKIAGNYWTNLNGIGYTFMVPVFFLLSGLFSQKSTKEIPERIKSMLSGIVYPYVLWSLIQAGLIIISGAGNTEANWTDIPSILINGWMQYWFLHCLILIILTDLAFRTLKLKASFRFAIVLSIACASMIGLKFPWQLQALSEHILYFEVGVIFAKFWKFEKRPINPYFLAYCGTILLIAFYVNGAKYEQPLRALSAFSGILLCISAATIISKSNNFISTFLATCGRLSLQIYVAHIIIAAALRVILFKIGIETFEIHLIVGFTLSLIGSILIAQIDKRTLNVLFRATHISKSVATNTHVFNHDQISNVRQ